MLVDSRAQRQWNETQLPKFVHIVQAMLEEAHNLGPHIEGHTLGATCTSSANASPSTHPACPRRYQSENGHGRQGVEQKVTRVRQRQQRRHEREKHLRAFRKTTGRTFTWYLTRRACIAKDTWRSRDCCRDRHVLHGGNQKKVASPQAATYARLNEARAAVSYRPIEAWATVSCLSNTSWAAPSCRSKGAWATVSQKSSRQSCRSLQLAPPFCAA